MEEITRNTADEDWDERRDGGKVVPEYELRDFTKILLRNGKERSPCCFTPIYTTIPLT